MKNKRLLLCALGVLLLDRITKMAFREADRVLIPGLLTLRGTKNPGIAFGWFSGRGTLLILLGAIALWGVYLLLRRRSLSRWVQYALGALAGGAAGNLLDRLLYGYVIDFIDIVPLHWFIFNIADAAITLGAGALSLFLLFGKENP